MMIMHHEIRQENIELKRPIISAVYVPEEAEHDSGDKDKLYFSV